MGLPDRLGVAGSKKLPPVAVTGGRQSEPFSPAMRGETTRHAPAKPKKVRRSAHGDHVTHDDKQPVHPKSDPGPDRPIALVKVPYQARDGARRRVDPRRP